ncbi:MAG: FlgD immunoglobulin-like domain containing protein, partial [Candidatus Neomarinimicrobiota bacterium]
TPHLGQKFEARLVDLYSGREAGRALLETIPSEIFGITVPGAQVGQTYWLDFYADFNDNGLYDAPSADHAWRLQVDAVRGDTTINFTHHTNFTDIDWPYLVTLNFTGMASLVNRQLEARMVDLGAGAEVERVRLDSIPRDAFALDLPGARIGHSYRLDFYADLNGNGAYDPPPTDQAWRLQVDNVQFDAGVNFSHNSSFTDIDWPYLLTLQLEAMTPHIEQTFQARLVHIGSGAEESRTRRDALPQEDFSVRLPGMRSGQDYQVDFYADFNGNGAYDPPPTDHAWRLQYLSAASDDTISFVHTTAFTDIEWPTGATETQVVSTPGEFTFAGTGVAMNVTSLSGDDTVTVSEINTPPGGLLPPGTAAFLDRYWDIDRTGTGAISLDLTLTLGSGIITPAEQAVPGNVGLLRRESAATEAWTAIRRAVAATDSSVTFAGLTGFSQFTVARNAVTDTVGPAELYLDHTPGSPAIGEDILVTAGLTDPAGVETATLRYLAGGASVFTEAPMTVSPGDTDTTSATIPGAAVTITGVLYRVAAVDSLGNISLSSSASPGISFPADTLTSAVTGGFYIDGFPKDRWRLISVPAQLDEPGVLATIGDELGDRTPQTWRIFSLENGNYVENPTSLQMGEGYWLYQRTADDLLLGTGPGATADLTGVSLLLQPGWNFIGSPFAFVTPLDADQGQFYGPLAYALDGIEDWSEDIETELLPWGGYALYNRASTSQSFLVDPLAASPALAKAEDPAPPGWTLQLSAVGATYSDRGNTIGRLQGAREGLDSFDNPEPPYIDGYLSLAMERPEWGSSLPRFTSDIRSPEVTDGVWDIELFTRGETGPVVLAPVLEGKLPAGSRIVLLDVVTRTVSDLSAEPAAVVIREVRDEFPYHLKVVAGSAPDVAAAVSEVLAGLPAEFALRQNYPNPFNPNTTLRYSLARPARLTLSVYDLRGREVARLVDGWQDLGHHEAIWDGRDQSGIRMASGLYFAAYRVEGRSYNRKMVLLK